MAQIRSLGGNIMIKSYENTGRHVDSDYAEVTIRCRHVESAADLEDIIDRTIERCHVGDFYIAAHTTPCYAQRRGYSGKGANQHLAIHIRSRMSESDYTGSSVSNDNFYRIWSEEFVELAKSTMTYVDCEYATVYLYGEGRNRIIPLAES